MFPLTKFLSINLKKKTKKLSKESINMKVLLIVYSYHHHNTIKVAEAFSEILDARISKPEDINPQEINDYDLIGFGSGIDSGKHYKQLLDFAQELPENKKKLSFVFSTSAVQNQKKLIKDHLALKTILINKGYVIIDEFSCKGYNTNSFLKYLGGMNKGRPNEDDLSRAKDFAKNLNRTIS